ncbi:MAG TPA: DHH family phosphoesterase, partial [Candidatus Aenigmarchaeota archaeon]|nr:DHH family phosphoesterase [Candidatus Aenigmarchaeota archaeon]
MVKFLILVEIERIVNEVKNIINERPVRLISHNDADGICSAAILLKALLREGSNVHLSIVKQLKSSTLDSLRINPDSFVIFTDLGSGQLDIIEKKLLDKTKVLILDHHEPRRIEHENLFHINPRLFKEKEVSASVISFFFARSLKKDNNDMIDLAIVGAVGDSLDEKWELKGLNENVLKQAQRLGKITVTRGIRLYGRNTRPIHKALELSMDPYIPGITGSESNAVEFLTELGIKVKENGKWRYLKDLSIEEQRKLASAIIVERLKGKSLTPEDIFGDIYIINDRKGELSNAREFATLLNACGRLGRPEVGLRLCYNDEEAIKEARELMIEYRKNLSEYIEWIMNNVNNENVIRRSENAVFILGGSRIKDTMIGVVTSIILNSDIVNNKFVFGLARTEEGDIKISGRAPREANLSVRD